MSNKVLLSSKDLSIGYGNKEILKDLKLEIKSGDVICLMGPNGSGKSTLLKTFVGLLKPLKGEVKILGRILKDLDHKELSKLVSVVLTERGNINGLTVEDIVRLGRFPHTNMWGKLEEKDRRIIKECIELLNLESLKSELASELSDGQLQKVFIARALAQDAPLIILDEPTTFLDISNKMELMAILDRISKARNKALLFSSHDWELALEMCPKVWLIDSTNSVISGTPEEFLYTGVIQKLFMHERFYLNNNNGRFCELKERTQKLKFKCDNSVVTEWVDHALSKIGYKIESEADLSVVFYENKFKVEGGAEFQSLSDLLDYLKLR
ncbi:MAG: iron ABC transporter ATP-binding protein [Halobacteriovorax sp.]|nr:iron ABC transporter ATP-binding protein [Halobacteriovorax sp.]|tara:strand:- start:12958 stop:13932 length:975 start_codon:yes stop_codon:yes gene_type:complete